MKKKLISEKYADKAVKVVAYTVFGWLFTEAIVLGIKLGNYLE